jgi:positive regulator of sigma E activity
MGSIDCIGQKGIIEEIIDGTARVAITTYSACANCDSKSSCITGESKSTIVDVKVEEGQFHKGEIVEVIMKKTLGLEATLLAYFVPFLVLIISLIIFLKIGLPDTLAGLLAIALLIPYFLILYFFRGILQNKFRFSLKKES